MPDTELEARVRAAKRHRGHYIRRTVNFVWWWSLTAAIIEFLLDPKQWGT